MLVNSTIKIYLLLYLICFCEVQTLNILGVFPVPAKSHFYVFSPYLKELANRGHNVTVISYYPLKEPVDNYHDINLSESFQPTELSLPINKSCFTVLLLITLTLGLFGPLSCSSLLEDENVQDLWKRHTNFDLVVVEQFNSDCSLALAYALKAPVIGITSHVLLPWHYSRFGVPYNPSYVAFDFLYGGTSTTLLQRITRSVLYTYINFIHSYVAQTLEQKIIGEYFNEVPALSELAKDIKLVLVYQNFALSGPTISPPNIIDVGGYHVAQPKSLPQDLKKFIEDSEHGVIYISFGSILKASTIPTDKLRHILNALHELPQRAIWKWNKKSLPANSSNIYLAKWMPQNDILAHPNVVAFFSHCGLLGTTEAIYHGVPVVGMPMYGDQPTNAAAVEERGIGVQVDLDSINKDYLIEKFNTVLNPQFREKVKQLSKLWHDQPIKAMDKAIFWTEYAAKYKNVTFRPPIVDTPLYQYLCLDVYLIFIVTFIIIFFFLKCLISFACSKIICRSQNVKTIKVN